MVRLRTYMAHEKRPSRIAQTNGTHSQLERKIKKVVKCSFTTGENGETLCVCLGMIPRNSNVQAATKTKFELLVTVARQTGLPALQ